MKRNIKSLISLCLSLLLLVSEAAPFCLAEEPVAKQVTVSSEADLRALRQRCRLDSWSLDTVVTLSSDIVLTKDFEPIPIFSGRFEGNGHSIRGLDVSGRTEHAGLFGILTESAEVTDLHVSGKVHPKGDVLYTGGIAALNRGTIRNCSFSGSVTGNTATGGIAGLNEGTILSCTNSASIDYRARKNVKLKVGSLIASIKENGVTAIIEAVTKGSVDVSDDCSGGIAGFNKGAVVSSVNVGSVGNRFLNEKRRNYNVGGIAGRNEGSLYLCSNSGSVCGYGNVGGVVGISTPHFQKGTSGNLLGDAQEDVNSIIDLVETISYNLDDGTAGITDAVSGIAGSLGNAMTSVSQLEREITGFANGKIGEVNEVKDYANTIVHGVKGMTGEISGVGDDINDISDNVYKGIIEVKNDNISGALDYFGYALNGVPKVIEDVNGITTELDNTLRMMDESGLPEFARISPGVDYAAACVTGNLRSATEQIKALSSALDSFELSLTDDIRVITDLAQQISDQAFKVIYSLDDLSLNSFLKDSSGDSDAASDPLPGIISCCVNTGTVKGFDKTGGIAGALAFMDRLSLDLSSSPEESQENGFSLKMLQYRDVVTGSRNYGHVYCKGDNAGGIAGYVQTGAVNECQAYGSVYSEGKYAGGILGSGRGIIRDCFVRSSISGSDYVGGILGSGEDKMLLFPEPTVLRNFADVAVASDDIHYGAIAGEDTGSFLYNYFTIGTLNGIGEYSEEFSAAPVNRSQILELDNCPDEFTWSRERLASTAAAENYRTFALTELESSALLFIMAVLLALIALLLYLLFRKPKSARAPKENNKKLTYKQPWKD